jgi:hypothetical protein
MSLENDETLDLTPLTPLQPQPLNGAEIHAQPHLTPSNPPPKNDLTPDYGRKLKNKKAKEKAGGSRATKVQTVIPVRTPDRQWYFRAHPDPEMSLPIDIVDIKNVTDEGVWYLDPDVAFPNELESFIIPAQITRCITSDGAEFFYLAKQSAKSPKESTRRCIREAKYKWIKQNWNGTIKAYEFQQASQLRREPKWSDTPLNELLDRALGDRFITRPDHEVINRLLFPDDEDGEQPRDPESEE